MSTLYLHIGTPKTGTTAIQHFLASNRRVLRTKGYEYPFLKMRFEGLSRNRNARFLIDKMNNKECNTPEYIEKINCCYESIYNLLDTYRNVILTEESIWHACNKIPDFWEDLYEKITSRGHQLKVIVYLRRQDEFIQSYWKYKVLKSETYSFMKYINSRKYKFFPLKYHSHLSSIADIIGRENVCVRVYEKEQYQGKDKTIISDFLHTIGLELTEEFKLDENLQNTSIDFICTEIKRRLNSNPVFWDKKGYIRGYLKEVTEANREEGKYQFKSLFMPEKQDLFLQKYEEENYKVAKEWLGREDGRLFYNPVSYDNQVKEFSSKDFIKTCGEIFLAMNQKREDLEQVKKALEQEKKSQGANYNQPPKKSLKGLREIINHVVSKKCK